MSLFTVLAKTGNVRSNITGQHVKTATSILMSSL